MAIKQQNRTAVLLAAYNGKEWINEQIESIFQQVGIRGHIFISVDLSTDGTFEWCKECEKKNQNVTVLSYGNRFGGAGKNFYRLIRDVDFSEFDYIAFADQDDVWLKNKLSHAINLIQENDLDGFSSDVTAFWDDGRTKVVKKSYPQKKFDYLFEAAGPGCTYVFTSYSLQKFKSFLATNWVDVNQVALHDWMIYAFMRHHDMHWYIDSQSLMHYRQHANNQVGFNSGILAYRKRISMVRQKWFRNEVRKISRLLNVEQPKRWFSIINFWQLRRRPRDAYAFLIMNVLGIY